MPSFLVRLEPSGWEFVSDDSASLLEAARDAGITLPSSCRNGTCRTCLCALSSGKVRYRIAWPGISAEEKEAGWILPCVAVAASDLQLESPYARQIAPE